MEFFWLFLAYLLMKNIYVRWMWYQQIPCSKYNGLSSKNNMLIKILLSIFSGFLADQAACYIQAIQWILHYYYHGVQSWSWWGIKTSIKLFSFIMFHSSIISFGDLFFLILFMVLFFKRYIQPNLNEIQVLSFLISRCFKKTFAQQRYYQALADGLK